MCFGTLGARGQSSCRGNRRLRLPKRKMRGNLSAKRATADGDCVNVRKQTLRLSCRWAASVQGTCTRARAALPWLAALAALTLATLTPAMPASAQGNIDAGKSPGQIFADTCAGCHKSARELKRANAG